jgi:hypothetical protein
MMKKILVAAFAAVAFAAPAAQATNLVTNGDFETGAFSPWSASSSNSDTGGCNAGWNVSSSGSATGCSSVASPLGSNFAAYQAFDGTGPKTRTLQQSISIPTGLLTAVLNFSQAYSFSYSGLSRFLDVDIIDGGTTINLFHEVMPSTGTVSWTPTSQDVAAALANEAGHSVQLEFIASIPSSFTGPAGFSLDNVTLDVTVPEPASMALLGAGLASLGAVRRRRAT